MSSRLQLSTLLSVALLTVACQGASPTPAEQTRSAAGTAGAPAAAETPRAGAPGNPAEADRHLQRALELEAAGQFPEARSEVDLALAAGAGRDAKLLAAKLAILRDDLDAASRVLEPLARDPAFSDALVLYNLGLIAQRRGEYNNARARYLAAIKADPTYTPARYNLAVLTWDAGVKDEAQHHARKFVELAPGDPLTPELRRKILGETPPGETPPAQPGSPPASSPPAQPASPPAGARQPAAKQ